MHGYGHTRNLSDEACPYNFVLCAGPRVIYCDTQFPPGDAGADVAAITKQFVDEWLGDGLRGYMYVTGWMVDYQAPVIGGNWRELA